MLKLKRVCVPLSLDCNFNCKYCYRAKETLDKISDFTEDMKDYLRNLKPDFCEAVIASGGEPLLHWDKVLELFSYVPKNVHKKIMSNCYLLTQDKVDYMNANDIELHMSHDGPKTEFLRGYDVLADNTLRDLIAQVKTIRCFSVITRYNTDVWENYFDTVKKLGRTDILYDTFPISDIPEQHDLVDGFDYDQWFTTWMQFRLSSFRHPLPWYNGKTLSVKPKVVGRPCGFNVLPDGTVCGMVHICSTYGTIHSESYHACRKKLIELGHMDYCFNSDCKYKDTCQYPPQSTSPHLCKCRRMIMDWWTPENKRQVVQYLKTHLDEIKEKYGYVEQS